MGAALKTFRWARVIFIELSAIFSVALIAILASSLQGKNYETAKLVADIVHLSVKYNDILASCIALCVVAAVTFLVANLANAFFSGFFRASGHIGLKRNDRKIFAIGGVTLILAWLGSLMAASYVLNNGKATVTVDGIPPSLIDSALAYFNVSTAFKDQPRIVEAVIVGWCAFATLTIGVIFALIESTRDVMMVGEALHSTDGLELQRSETRMSEKVMV